MTARATIKAPIERRRTCAACGRMGHLQSNCRLPVRRIDKIGIEIEGYWYDLTSARNRAEELTGTEGTEDGSLSSYVTVGSSEDDDSSSGCGDPDCDDPDCDQGSSGTRRAHGWEFQTAPGTLGEALRQLTALYPDVTAPSAGMHVHFSLAHWSDFTMLASDRFYRRFRDGMRAWGQRMGVRGTFWDRLEGRNQYCRPNSEAEDHAYTGSARDGTVLATGGKYKQVNLSGYADRASNPTGQRRTVEIRLLPMFQKASIAISAVETLVEIVESYLDERYESTPVMLAPLDTESNLGPIRRAIERLIEHDPIVIEPTVTEVPAFDDVIVSEDERAIDGATSLVRPALVSEVETYSLDDVSPGATVALRCDALRAIETQLRNAR